MSGRLTVGTRMQVPVRERVLRGKKIRGSNFIDGFWRRSMAWAPPHRLTRSHCHPTRGSAPQPVSGHDDSLPTATVLIDGGRTHVLCHPGRLSAFALQADERGHHARHLGHHPCRERVVAIVPLGDDRVAVLLAVDGGRRRAAWGRAGDGRRLTPRGPVVDACRAVKAVMLWRLWLRLLWRVGWRPDRRRWRSDRGRRWPDRWG